MKKVTITADKSGQVVTPGKNNADYGFVRVSQVRTNVNEDGWAKSSILSALILGSVSDLKKAGYQNGEELEGQIIVKEQLAPFNAVNPDKDLKVAGETGIICKVGKSPIYRKAFYDQKGTGADILLEHTNADEIKAKKAKLEKADLSK